MEKKGRDRIKFSNIDIFEFMGGVVKKHTRYHQSDFLIDKEMMIRATYSQEQQEKTFIWLCRTSGTWCLLERNVFLKDTSENKIFNFYAEQTDDLILAFVIEIKSKCGSPVTGDIYVLDHKKHYQHVKETSINAETVLLKYEHGERIQRADIPIDIYPDMGYGELKSIQYQPHSQKELSGLLSRERQERKRFKESDPYSYAL